MTDYFMDEDRNLVREAATAQDLSNWANNYHKKYFAGWSEPSIQIQITDEAGEMGCFVPALKVIRLPDALTTFQKSCRIVLLHELVHVELYTQCGDADSNHGERFKAQVKRLIGCGAYDNLL